MGVEIGRDESSIHYYSKSSDLKLKLRVSS